MHPDGARCLAFGLACEKHNDARVERKRQHARDIDVMDEGHQLERQQRRGRRDHEPRTPCVPAAERPPFDGREHAVQSQCDGRQLKVPRRDRVGEVDTPGGSAVPAEAGGGARQSFSFARHDARCQ